jgi:hypothetical protein
MMSRNRRLFAVLCGTLVLAFVAGACNYTPEEVSAANQLLGTSLTPETARSTGDQIIQKTGDPEAVKKLVFVIYMNKLKDSLPQVPAIPSDEGLQRLRTCESQGNYQINTGNGYYGAYQFTLSTWRNAANGAGRPWLAKVMPNKATPADQDLLTRYLWQHSDESGQWPVCYARV